MKLTQDQIDQFNTEGYLVVKQILLAHDLTPMLAEYAAYIDQRARDAVIEHFPAALNQHRCARTFA